jgi:predicted nucleic acid-binding protein
VLHVPALCDIEVAAALRRAWRTNKIGDDRLGEALADYLAIALTRHAHAPLLERVLSLRHNFTAYDAAYVTLAERLGAELITADEPLARAVRGHLRLPVVYAQ